MGTSPNKNPHMTCGFSRADARKWRSLRDSNPCFSLERATSWASRRREHGTGRGGFVVPEYIQDAATPVALADAVTRRLQDVPGNERLVARFQEIHRQLACGCAERVADAVMAQAGGG